MHFEEMATWGEGGRDALIEEGSITRKREGIRGDFWFRSSRFFEVDVSSFRAEIVDLD